jgi:hypothetical protein
MPTSEPRTRPGFGHLARPMHGLFRRTDLASASAFLRGGWGRRTSALRLPVPSAHAMAKRPMRVIIAAAVFAFGMLAGAGIAAWLMPPA